MGMEVMRRGDTNIWGNDVRRGNGQYSKDGEGQRQSKEVY